MTTDVLLWICFVAAAVVVGMRVGGWWAQRRALNRPTQAPAADYYHGLNYLLDEQPDLAIDAIANALKHSRAKQITLASASRKSIHSIDDRVHDNASLSHCL